MPQQTIISPLQNVFTLVNVFTVAPERQRQLVDALIETTDTVVRHLPGFISASIHASSDGTRVVNYGQWEDQAAFERMMGDAVFRARLQLAAALGQPDGHFYAVVATLTTEGE